MRLHTTRTTVLVIATFVMAAAPIRSVRAETVLWKTEDLLKTYFPSSTEVVGKKHALSAAQRDRISDKTKSRVKGSYTVFEARTGNRVDGYAIIDHEVGQVLPMTFAVKLTPAGVVDRVDLMVLREPRGQEIRELSFLKQFAGKTHNDAVEVGADITLPLAQTPMGSVATRANAVAVTKGVRRAIALIHEVVISK